MGEFLGDIWKELLIGLITFLLGYFWSQLKSLKEWNSKEFRDKINISLNILEPLENNEYKLEIRTLLETKLKLNIHNNKVKDLINKAIDETKPGKPLLIFKKKDAFYILNAILNQLANQFSNGILKKDLGIPVTSEWYTFCLTYEKEQNVRMQKLRVLIIKRDLLKNFPDNSVFVLESFNHDVRIQTLQILKQELKEHPHCFMNIELCQ